MKKMKYRDIIGIEATEYASVRLHTMCVVWTAGHETGLFEVDTDVHPTATHVWLFPRYFEGFRSHQFTHKFKLEGSDWKLVEVAEGTPDFKRLQVGNPFCPYDKKYTGGHFATCKFKQNRISHDCGICQNTVMVEGRRLVMGVQE